MDQSLLLYYITKICYSILFGFIIGLEREINKRPGGVCTHILVSVGSTIYTIISYSITVGDKGRIAAQIVSGIGFIGGGTIYKSDNCIKGINTAAAVWLSASVGMAVGSDNLELGLIGSLLTITILFINSTYERYKDKCTYTYFSRIVKKSSDIEIKNTVNYSVNNTDN